MSPSWGADFLIFGPKKVGEQHILFDSMRLYVSLGTPVRKAGKQVCILLEDANLVLPSFSSQSNYCAHYITRT